MMWRAVCPPAPVRWLGEAQADAREKEAALADLAHDERIAAAEQGGAR